MLNNVSASVGGVLKPAGLDNSKDLLTAAYLKEPTDPRWKDDPGFKEWSAFMEKYYPDGDRTSGFTVYGYLVSQTLVQALKQCGDDLTRENVMKQATSLKGLVVDLALPGMSGSTSPTDYRVNKQLQMMKFNGERWELFGPIIEDNGPAG